MVHKKRPIGAGAIVLGLALAACGHSGTSNTISSNAQAQAAETIVKDCVNKGNLLTPAGLNGILHCIAPPGHTNAFLGCAQSQLAKANLFTGAGRDAYLQALAVCLEQNR